VPKVADSPARPTADRVQGIDSKVDDLTIRAAGRSVKDHLELEVGVSVISNPKLTRTIYGASSVELEVLDPERRLLRHSLVSEKWDAEMDGLHFRYPGGLTKSGDILTLTLEDRWIALLREKEGPKRVVRGQGAHQMTRAEFIKMLVEEACGKGLRFFCPQLHVQQPIDNKEKAKKAKEEAKANRGKGLGDVKHLTIDGAEATAAQRELGHTALIIAESYDAPFAVQVSLIEALMAESSMGSASPGNVLQALEPYTKVRPAEEEISGFVAGKPMWTGTTAIDYYKTHSNAAPHEIAQAVQKSGAGESSDGASNYGKFDSEARKWVEAFGGEGGESIDVTEPYEFVVKKKQDYWSAIKKLAKDVNWRAFVVGNVFYFMPEPELSKGMVRLAIDNESVEGDDSGIEKVDFEYDGNHPVTEIEIEALVSQWKPPPGCVVTLADHGPASIGFGEAPVKEGISQTNLNTATLEGRGRYILSSIEVPLADDPAQRMATIKAHRATPKLPEPANKTRSISGVTPGAEGNRTVERMLEAMEQAADKEKPYVWGGFDPDTGFDCSGAVSYALKIGGFLEERLTTVTLASFGESGPGQWITIYDHANTGDPHTEHTAIEIAGVVFESGGGSENSNPNGGLGKVTSGVKDFLKQFEIKRHPKGF
jgi:hypothetical protein